MIRFVLYPDVFTILYACKTEKQKALSLRHGGLRRQRGVFQEGSRPCPPEHRRKQHHRGGIYVPGQNAAGGEGALSQDEGAARAPGKSRYADRKFRPRPAAPGRGGP